MWLGIGYTIGHQGDRNLNNIEDKEFYLLHEDGRILKMAAPYENLIQRAEAPSPI